MLSVIALTVASAPVLAAGYKERPYTVIRAYDSADPSKDTFVSGSFGTARNFGFAQDTLECGTSSYTYVQDDVTYTSTYGYCMARTYSWEQFDPQIGTFRQSTGPGDGSVYCYTYEPSLIDVIAHMQSDAKISYFIQDGLCNGIQVSTGSQFTPKVQ